MCPLAADRHGRPPRARRLNYFIFQWCDGSFGGCTGLVACAMCGHRRVMQAITLAGHDVAKVAISASCARELAVLNSNGPPMVFTS